MQELQESAHAGPSTEITTPHSNMPTTSRKPRARHPSRPLKPIHKLRPPAPIPDIPSVLPETLPIKVLQGARTRRTDAVRAGFGRETIFVTRKTELGALLGRARSLVLDEGYPRITLYALSAAIPHALLLLHALIDVLPYPTGKRGMWYEMRTGSVECVDEVPVLKGPAGGEDLEVAIEDEFAGLGDLEEDEPERRVRIKSSLQIDLHISPRNKNKTTAIIERTKNTADVEGSSRTKRKSKGKARPSAKKRRARAAERRAVIVDGDEGEEDDEEMMMNAGGMGEKGVIDDYDEEAEVLEEI